MQTNVHIHEKFIYKYKSPGNLYDSICRIVQGDKFKRYQEETPEQLTVRERKLVDDASQPEVTSNEFPVTTHVHSIEGTQDASITMVAI